jgi:hypothetical protein
MKLSNKVQLVLKFLLYWVFAWWLILHEGETLAALLFAFIYAWILLGISSWNPGGEKNEKTRTEEEGRSSN